jgi:excisionase family DNA binding protein
MPELSLSQAAKLTGKSKSTINRAIKTGKLSAVRHGDGSYSIDPAELSRAFDVEPSEGAKRCDTEPDGTSLLERLSALEALLSREREISADLKEDRDRWRQQATALLADQRPPSQPNQLPRQRSRGFWKQLFG